jgi:hypothetical protein
MFFWIYFWDIERSRNVETPNGVSGKIEFHNDSPLPFLATIEKVYKITFRAEENRLVKCFFEKNYCKRRKLKLTHHCIDERSEELAVRGGISVESLLV